MFGSDSDGSDDDSIQYIKNAPEYKDSTDKSGSSKRRGRGQLAQKSSSRKGFGLMHSKGMLEDIPEIEQVKDSEMPRDSVDFLQSQLNGMKPLDSRTQELAMKNQSSK